MNVHGVLIELKKKHLGYFRLATIGRQVNLNWYENIHSVKKSQRPWSAVNNITK